MQRNNEMKKNIFQILKFGLIGILNTALDYFLFFIFFSLLNIDKNLAQVLATAIAMTNSYFFNRYWTFNKQGKAQFGEMWKFVVVNIVSMCVTILCLNLFYDVMHIENIANSALSAVGVSYQLLGDSAVMFCKLVAVPFSLAVNFLGNRLWVFSKKTDKKAN